MPDSMMTNTENNSRFSFRAYFISIGVSLVILTGWIIGPEVGTWAAAQNRAQTEIPSYKLAALTHKETFVLWEAAATDRLKIKPVIVGGINRALLETTGLTLSPIVTAATIIPTIPNKLGIHTPIYYAEDFYAPCSRNSEEMAKSLTAFQQTLKDTGKKGFFLIAPNKSTVTLDVSEPWAAALMQCSIPGFEELTNLAESNLPVAIDSPSNVRGHLPVNPYFSGDSHWKPVAADSMISVIRNQLGYSFSIGEPASQERIPFIKGQDLLHMLTIDVVEEAASNPYNSASVIFTDGQLKSGAPVKNFVNSSSTNSGERALLVVDSFTDASDMEARMASQFGSGQIVKWDHFSGQEDFSNFDVIVLETVERSAYSRIASFGKYTKFLERFASTK